MEARDLSFDEIKVGDTASFERTVSVNDIDTFAELSGDNNPLHMDEAYAASTQFGKRVVHGMLLGALTSTLLGMYLPGKRCLYLSEKLTFKKPCFIGDSISVHGKVTHKSTTMHTLIIGISIRRGDEELVSGEAVAQVLK